MKFSYFYKYKYNRISKRSHSILDLNISNHVKKISNSKKKKHDNVQKFSRNLICLKRKSPAIFGPRAMSMMRDFLVCVTSILNIFKTKTTILKKI